MNWEALEAELLNYVEWFNRMEWDENGELVKAEKGKLADKYIRSLVRFQLDTVIDWVIEKKEMCPDVDFDFCFDEANKKFCLRIDTTAYFGQFEKKKNFFVKLTARNRKKGA